MTNYVVVGSKPWNRQVFESVICRNPGHWVFWGHRDDFTFDRLAEVSPRYVFVLHWSWIVPPSIVNTYECVCFHMTDLPFGRGGSPLQNLIVRGYQETVVTAFRMNDELDAGPIYLKRPLSLAGSAQDIYVRATNASARMITQIIETQPEPVPQSGNATTFTRRDPGASRITASIEDLDQLHDQIRMLDAPGYPPAFIKVGPFKLSFRKSELGDDRVRAEVEVTRFSTED